jgi:hypothetical protein
LGYDTLSGSTDAEGNVMIEISFSVLRRQVGELEWERVAVLHVDGTHVEVEGDQDFGEVRDIEVFDVESGQSVTFDADPERWARNLPNAFRSGDLVCEVTHDAASTASTGTGLTARA